MTDRERELRRILVIDDNESIHRDFDKIIGTTGSTSANDELDAELFGDDSRFDSAGPRFELVHALQGKEGLSILKQAMEDEEEFDVAFVDMRMPPGWDGVETIKHLWQTDPRLQVVICTAFSDRTWNDITDELGQTDRLLILKKPFDSTEVSQLATALSMKRRLANTAAMRLEELEVLVKEKTRILVDAHRESERLLTAISSLLIGVDLDRKIQRWNEEAERMFALKSSEVIGQKLDALEIDWVDVEQLAALFERPNDTSHSQREIAFVDVDGNTRVLGLSLSTIESQGKQCGTLLLGADITEHRMLENQLQQAQKLESVGQLAAGVAHEINTPMQYLGDNLDYLKNKMEKLGPLIESLETLKEFADQGAEAPKDSKGEELIAQLTDSVKKLKTKKFLPDISEAIGDSQDGIDHVSRIVRAMKEFAHPGQEEKSQVDINHALESTISVATNEWKYVADIVRDFDEELPAIAGHASELNQVFLNLIVNASHAISDVSENGGTGKGTITLSTRSRLDHVEVAISDTGTGIPDGIKQRIFDPFFTTKEVGKGTGQGLSIAYSVVVQKHGGRLTCDSTPGNGTKFTILLPINPVDNCCEEDDEVELVTS